LIEDVLGRQRGHAGARGLLEELLTAPGGQAVNLRVARLLGPLYEQSRQWQDLVGVLRVERAHASGADAVELLARIAVLEETELNAARNAFDACVEILRLEPAYDRARTELARLA